MRSLLSGVMCLSFTVPKVPREILFSDHILLRTLSHHFIRKTVGIYLYQVTTCAHLVYSHCYVKLCPSLFLCSARHLFSDIPILHLADVIPFSQFCFLLVFVPRFTTVFNYYPSNYRCSVAIN